MKATKKELREALESMVWQYAYRVTQNDKLCLVNGGLSPLEEAFYVLGWENPHYIDDPTLECDIEGCHDWRSPQIEWDGVYACICDKHFSDYLAKKPLPKLKQSALDREARRDKVTGILSG